MSPSTKLPPPPGRNGYGNSNVYPPGYSTAPQPSTAAMYSSDPYLAKANFRENLKQAKRDQAAGAPVSRQSSMPTQQHKDKHKKASSKKQPSSYVAFEP